MSNSRKLAYAGVAVLMFTGAAVGLVTTRGTEVRAQTPPAPCECSRMTPIVRSDEIATTPGPLQPRFGIVHCQCGAATCVSQVSYASVGVPQLFCVK